MHKQPATKAAGESRGEPSCLCALNSAPFELSLLPLPPAASTRFPAPAGRDHYGNLSLNLPAPYPPAVSALDLDVRELRLLTAGRFLVTSAKQAAATAPPGCGCGCSRRRRPAHSAAVLTRARNGGDLGGVGVGDDPNPRAVAQRGPVRALSVHVSTAERHGSRACACKQVKGGGALIISGQPAASNCLLRSLHAPRQRRSLCMRPERPESRTATFMQQLARKQRTSPHQHAPHACVWFLVC